MTAVRDTAVPDFVSLADRRRLRAGRTLVSDAGAMTVVVAVLHEEVNAQRIYDALDQVLKTATADDAVTEARETVLALGDVTMNLTSLRVTLAGGSSISLTYQEFRLLRTFLEHPGQVLTRAQLMAQAWDYAGDSRTVDVHVRRLRMKLAASSTHITTLRGFGYRFDADAA